MKKFTQLLSIVIIILHAHPCFSMEMVHQPAANAVLRDAFDRF